MVFAVSGYLYVPRSFYLCFVVYLCSLTILGILFELFFEIASLSLLLSGEAGLSLGLILYTINAINGIVTHKSH